MKIPIIASLFCFPVTAAVTNVQVTGTTSTQAAIHYTAPSSAACTVEVSEEADYTPLVHDVNPSLFTGANLDSRATSATIGRERVFVIGKRTIETENVTENVRKNNYSRALQAATIHYFRVTCGGDTATGTFTTKTVPLGMSRTDGYQPDELYPGEPKQITVDKTTRNFTWIDPHTGVQARLLQIARDYPEDFIDRTTTRVAGSGTNWTTPDNISTSAPATYAVYDGASCSGTCDSIMVDAAAIGSAYVPLAVDNYTLKLTGFGSSATAADRQVEVCLAPNAFYQRVPWGDPDFFTRGTVCDIHAGAIVETVTLPQSTEAEVSITSTFRQPGFSIQMAGFQLEDAGNNGQVVVRVLVRKATGTGTISVRNALVSIAASHKSNVGSAGSFDRCSSLLRSDGTYLCATNQGGETTSIYSVHGETGETRFLGRIAGSTPYGAFSCYMEHQPFSFTDPNILYCQPAGIASIGKFTYIGPGTNRASNYAWIENTDFTVTWPVTDFVTKMQAFYTAHASEWEGMLGGAGAFHPFSGGLFSTCGIGVQGDNFTAGCVAGAQDSASWNAVFNPSGDVIAMTPQYATAPHRWCANHSAEVYADQPVICSSPQKMFYKSQLESGIGPGDTTITLTSSCSPDCAGFTAGDPVSYSTDYRPENLMPIQIGDSLMLTCFPTSPSTPGVGTGCEHVIVTGKAGNVLTISRAQWGSTALSHSTNAAVFPSCSALTGSTLVPWNFQSGAGFGMWTWDWVADPYGTSTDGSGVWTRPYVGHEVTRGNRNVNNDQVIVGPPGTKLGAVDKAFVPTWRRWQPLGFGGEDGTGTGNTYQQHPSLMNLAETGLGFSSYMDGHPFIGGSHITVQTPSCNPNDPAYDVNPTTGCPVVKVAGFSHVYRYVHGTLFPFRPKHYATFGTSYADHLRDISGPGSVIDDTKPFTFCVAVAAGECVAGSSAGHMFAAFPWDLTATSCTGGEDVTGLRDLCISNTEWLSAGYTQTVFGVKNKRGMKNVASQYAALGNGAGSVRLLARHATAGGYRRMSSFASMKATANGKFALVTWLNNHEGARIAVLKVPPLQVDSVDRTQFAPVTVQIPAGSLPAGTSNVIAEFGYSETSAPSLYRCTTRAETCVAHRSTINNSNPFSYATTEAGIIDSGLACGSGCSLVIPAYPGRVLYYRVIYRDAGNAVIQNGLPQVVAVP